MGCYHPLKGFPNGYTNQGRTNFIVTSARVDHIEIDNQGSIRKCFSRGISANTKLCISGSEAVEIPCGQCIGCRLDYSNQWASRCLLEMQNYKENCFITLTYDDEHVPESYYCTVKDHKEHISLTLCKRDLQLFWKSLRKAFPGKKIRYYACGEYGDHTARPHYHAIVFGLMPDDLIPASSYNDKFVDTSELGYNYYVSPKLNSIWKRGCVLVTNASWETAAYTARYVMKKLKGMKADFYDHNCIIPEFVTMSRRPGIGADWFEDNKKCYSIFLKQYIKTEKGSRELCTIRYFDNKLDESYPFDLQKIKKTRKEFEKYRKKLKQQETSIPYLDLLEIEEKLKIDRTKIFKRINF